MTQGIESLDFGVVEEETGLMPIAFYEGEALMDGQPARTNGFSGDWLRSQNTSRFETDPAFANRVIRRQLHWRGVGQEAPVNAVFVGFAYIQISNAYENGFDMTREEQGPEMLLFPKCHPFDLPGRSGILGHFTPDEWASVLEDDSMTDEEILSAYRKRYKREDDPRPVFRAAWELAPNSISVSYGGHAHPESISCREWSRATSNA